MSTKGKLTREQVVAMVGSEAVDKVDAENCDFTNRLQTDGDNRVEFSSSVLCEDKEGYESTLIAYYYQDDDDLVGVEDLSDLTWTIAGYEVV